MPLTSPPTVYIYAQPHLQLDDAPFEGLVVSVLPSLPLHCIHTALCVLL